MGSCKKSYFSHWFSECWLCWAHSSGMGDVCMPLSVCRYMLFYLIWRTLHGLHRSISLNFMVAGHTKFAPDWCFGLLKMRFRGTRVSRLGDIEEPTNASTVTGVNVAQQVGTEDHQVNVRLYDWQTFLSDSDAFIWSYCRPRRPLLRPKLVAVAEATWWWTYIKAAFSSSQRHNFHLKWNDIRTKLYWITIWMWMWQLWVRAKRAIFHIDFLNVDYAGHIRQAWVTYVHMPLSVCRYMLFYLIWRTMHGLHRSITLNFMVAGHTKFAPDWCFGLLKMRFRRTHMSCLGDIEEPTNASTVTGVNVAQLVGTEDQQVNVRLYDWQTFLSDSDAFIWSYCRPRRPLLRPKLVAVAEATWWWTYIKAAFSSSQRHNFHLKWNDIRTKLYWITIWLWMWQLWVRAKRAIFHVDFLNVDYAGHL